MRSYLSDFLFLRFFFVRFTKIENFVHCILQGFGVFDMTLRLHTRIVVEQKARDFNMIIILNSL